MLARYTLPEMQELWSEESKFNAWLRVELAVLRAKMQLGIIPPEAYGPISVNARFSVARINELEATYKHDMIAFVESVRESLVGTEAEPYRDEIHKGITSYDTEDPAMVLLLRQAVELILEELRMLQLALLKKALEHQWTIMVARTHGQYAEPTTFGHMLLVYHHAINRSIDRLEQMSETELSEGKLSGAVGSHAGMHPDLERLALANLDLKPAAAETQILQRDRHAMVLAAIATAGATIEQMCRTFWEMMRSDVGELEEPRKATQRGSSAMPHKKNPILTEQLQGLARLLRADAHTAQENIATPECRDISQSSVERHIFSGSTALLHYMARKATGLVTGLVVFPDRMEKTMERTLGVWAGQRLCYALVERGFTHSDAYAYVQRCAFKAVEEITHLHSIVAEDQRVCDDHHHDLDEATIAEIFNAHSYIEAGIEKIFQNVA